MRKTSSAKKPEKKQPTLAIIKDDPWLEPYAQAIEGRHQDAVNKIAELTGGQCPLCDFANAHHYYGLHRTEDRGWVLREWAPNATDIYVIGQFNDWRECAPYRMKRLNDGNWELVLPERAMKHGDLFKLRVHWQGGEGERIPAYATRVVQDDVTKIFSAQVWAPERPYEFKVKDFVPNVAPLLIYECHIGMGQDKEAVGSYDEFRRNVLPRVVAGGYNAIQIMAIQEHPYYGSFGYHVSSFYAASSRFGTPDELKQLIDDAHAAGVAVIMDIVHSHAVKNEVEGLGRFDGSYDQYFYGDGRREHPAWDSLCFDYGKNAVLNFLLSNCKFWLEEYRFDGFRFDGVTSMLYYNHGLGQAFGSYDDYYNGGEDTNAITYLTLANVLIHQVNPHAITIAEEMSGMPGLARTFEDGGIGFDYRMAMGIPDYWIKTIKEKKDEDWKPTSIFWELTNRRADEKTISYAESHDQALVGDKTIIFRLIDKEMYWHMMVGDHDGVVDRGMALHKMIRLVTASTINGGYLNFMGNEWGHPEWIDFPREGNGWSHKYARRQWSLSENGYLKYSWLNEFDKDMIHFMRENGLMGEPVEPLWIDQQKKLIVFRRKGLIFLFNLHPSVSQTDYFVAVPLKTRWITVFSSDRKEYGGQERISEQYVYTAQTDANYGPGFTYYLPARSAAVLKEVKGE